MQPSCHGLRVLSTAYLSDPLSSCSPLPLTLLQLKSFWSLYTCCSLHVEESLQGQLLSLQVSGSCSLLREAFLILLSRKAPFPHPHFQSSRDNRLYFLHSTYLKSYCLVTVLFVYLSPPLECTLYRLGSRPSDSLLHPQPLALGLAQSRCPIDNC